VRSDQIQLEWTAPTDTNISYYRVYYSRTSILANGGKYDDFEITPGKATSFTLTGFPQTSKLFVAVLAVNENGEESPYFTEEAVVNLGLPGTTSSVRSSAPSSSSSSSVATDMQKLLSVKVLSSTGVLLTFSLPVSLAQENAAKAFEIDDGSGALLALRQLIIKDNTITIKTAPQLKDHPYTLDAGNVLKGKSSLGILVDLDPSTASVRFMGDANGREPFLPSLISSSSSSRQSSSDVMSSSSSESSLASSSSSSAVQAMQILDVTDLRLEAQRQEDGSYTVVATWKNQNDPDTVSALQLQQTRDRGVTYASPQMAPATLQSARFSQVPAGDFGIMIKVRSIDGTLTRGAVQTVSLPVTGNTSTPLTNSGPSIFLLVVAAGGTAGSLWMKKKQLA
jgi:hypothetical protein